ncbi:ATP-dependent zinc metalloprotease FtsH [Pseudomonas sp. Bi70]|uniref:AAA family ATPase n=1 Tax=unclassified Pseudomonas TaxID=196821 RepID=UPI000DACA4DD|nr:MULTISPECIES: AAA family ATPase [unclassified Pseudomonas]MBD9657461.1 AAA family ATPase [Pseudomonas sp. PDM12]PZW41113.1 SpoVK/Ycf46/Vps4 family AAA+-type ATPase [Pseudomonas sp. URMO17WK12:I2]CAH0226175.1 ATP-dependent zinc metalloprotease FtsH [Pseudomonas sp. Bi70]
MKNDIHDLGLVLDSKVKLVLIESWDERRVLETLTGLAVRRGLSLFTWSITDGLQRAGFAGEAFAESNSQEPEAALRLIKADPQASLYVMCDLHPFLADNPKLVRLLKEVAMVDAAHAPTLVLVSHACKLPPEVQRYAARFNLALPSEDELLAIVREEAARWSERNRNRRVRTDNRTLQQVVKNLRGMSHAEARLLARNLICDDGAITQEDLPELNKAKFELLDLDGVLSYEHDTARFADVGGLANLKRWLGERQRMFFAGEGVDIPKGMLLVGVQGSGKSLAAKAVAGLWGLPLLRLDFGCLYNKFFGETERNLREALALAEQMSPCVLWVDEIEKGLASGDQDGGVSQRVLGTLLTWMAERKSSVFMVATANVIDRLPPELVRKGRFDELFFVDLPEPEIRAEIFRIHLQRRELEPSAFDLAQLAAASDGFSGAEIEQVVVSALYAAQAQQQSVDNGTLLRGIQATSPLSVIMAERLAELRAWARGRTVSAN